MTRLTLKEVFMKSVYPVLITEQKEKGKSEFVFLVEVPDLEILTEGKDLPDAIYMARDAIELRCVYYEDEKRDIPAPSRATDIDAGKGTFSAYGDTIVTMVDIDTAAYRRKIDNTSVRRNVTLPRWLDMQAKEAKINVSKVLQEALKEELGIA